MPLIHIILLIYIWVIILLMAMTDFLIKNGLVISYITGKYVWGIGMRPVGTGGSAGT